MDTRDKNSGWRVLAAGIRGLWPRLRHMLIEPRSAREDDRRKEFILNVILLSSLLLFTVFDGCVLYDSLAMGPAYRGLAFPIFSLLVLFLAALLGLSRVGYFRFSAYIVLAVLFGLITYAAKRWGMDLPAVLLGYALVITVAGILVSTRFGIWAACGGIVILAFLGWREIRSGVLADNYWKQQVLTTANIIEYSLMLLYLTLVSALSNREIEKSLIRARGSEAALKVERDNLEITVQDRTRELRESQLRQLSQHAQFAELGRLASGYVHDLANPLTVLSLSVENLSNQNVGQASEALRSAMDASRRMGDLLGALRQQIRQDDQAAAFSAIQELRAAVQLLNYKAKSAQVKISMEIPGIDIVMNGSPSKFHQIVSNLLSNAIESFADLENFADRKVAVSLSRYPDHIILRVTDNGPGIGAENLLRVFEPFFSTKAGHGLGIACRPLKQL